MTNLKLIKSDNFIGTQADIYSNGEDMFMTANQLGECLGYANPRESINKLVSRNEYLRAEEFSSEVVLTSEAGERQTRVFTEDGIYEVTMLSRASMAKIFRSWVRKVLKSLRVGVATQHMTQAEIIAKQANLLVDMEQRINSVAESTEKVNDRLSDALHTLTTPTTRSWKVEMVFIISQICVDEKFSLPAFRGKLYKELEAMAKCNLSARQRNLRDRLKRGGATYKERKAISKIDVIERDEKLKLIFDGIVRRYQVKYMR